MKPTVLTLTGGDRAFVPLKPSEIRRRIAFAIRKGRPKVELAGRFIEVARIIEVDGQELPSDEQQAA